MNSDRLSLVAVLIVFAIALVLLLGLIVLKAAHRRRDKHRERRRQEYITLLSRHLTFEHHTEPITEKMASDEAFIDAIIDLRTTVAGPGADKLAEIANRHGIIERRTARLRQRFPLGRRLRSAVALAEMGNSASFDVLVEHLNDREDEIKVQSIRGLSRIGRPEAIAPILESYGSETPWVRARFADALVGFGGKAALPIMRHVAKLRNRGESDAAAELIRVLGLIGDTRAGMGLTDLLATTADPEIKIAAVQALGSVGGPLAIPTILDAYHSEDWRIAAKAATALGEVGDNSVLDELANGLTHRVWWVRRNSAAALAAIPGGIAVLYQALTSPDPFARDAAAEALDDCGELAKARTRYERGEANRDELRLIRHMRGSETVPA